MDLGRIGIWMPKRFGAGAVTEMEALGYGTLWLGGSPSVQDAVPFLEASSTITIATGILNVWQHEPAHVAAAHAETGALFPGRFLLGVGIGHPEATSDYTRPLANMRRCGYVWSSHYRAAGDRPRATASACIAGRAGLECRSRATRTSSRVGGHGNDQRVHRNLSV